MRLTKGKAIYTPYLPPSALTGEDNLMHMLRLYSSADLDACPLDRWGILDPGPQRHDINEPREDGELRRSRAANSSYELVGTRAGLDTDPWGSVRRAL